jgi:hypothetical protein
VEPRHAAGFGLAVRRHATTDVRILRRQPRRSAARRATDADAGSKCRNGNAHAHRDKDAEADEDPDADANRDLHTNEDADRHRNATLALSDLDRRRDSDTTVMANTKKMERARPATAPSHDKRSPARTKYGVLTD